MWLVVAAAGLTSCSGGDEPPDVVLTSIDLTPPSVTLQEGAAQQFTATGHFSDGTTAAITPTWTATGGAVSSSGLYTAGAVAGAFQVVATAPGTSISKAAAVTVTAGPPVLTSISVAPATISLAPAATQQFTATGHYSGGGTGSVAVNWSATGGTINAAGLYTAGATAGPYQVTATLIGGAMAGTAAVTITPAPPTLTSVTVAPLTVTLVPAATQQFAATGHYSDGSTSTTLPMTWTAAGGTVNATGLYTAGAEDGNYQVTATATGTIAGHATVTIATPPPNLVAIEISPDSARLLYNPSPPYTNGRQQFTAVGRLSNGSTSPVAVTWSTTTFAGNPRVNTIGSDGLFAAGEPIGRYIVTATQAGGSLTATVPVIVHSTTGYTLPPGPAFWTPVAGAVRLCTSNHYTDDGTRAGIASATATGGDISSPTIAITTDPTPQTYSDGTGEVRVLCQTVWSAPTGFSGTATVILSVASTRPGTGMAKVFRYTKLVCYADPPTNAIERPCGRADFTQQANIPDPNWTTQPVADTVVVSSTTGANIWFKLTYVP